MYSKFDMKSFLTFCLFLFLLGVVLPIGLGLSLFVNGTFLADKIHADMVLTLPDVFAKRYGKVVELLVSVTTIVSFIMLLAGNLVGMGVIAAHVWGVQEAGAIWISSAVIWAYTVTGGLFSVAYTDVFQAAFGFVGCLVMAYWFIFNEDDGAPQPSIGFPGTSISILKIKSWNRSFSYHVRSSNLISTFILIYQVTCTLIILEMEVSVTCTKACRVGSMNLNAATTRNSGVQRVLRMDV